MQAEKAARLIVLASVMLLGAAVTSQARLIFVDRDASGAANGSSWTDAYRNLRDALAVASSGDEIRAAEGIYRPDLGTGSTTWDRGATFWLINGVVIKGGYAGFGEPDPDARDITKYESILTGDLKGDDTRFAGPVDLRADPKRVDNCYHVVTSQANDATAVLDGFTVSGGNANGVYPHYDGGGLCNNASSPTLNNCTFSSNSADNHGGGMCSINCSRPTLLNCTFSGNSAARGGGMYGGAGELRQCLFVSNWAEQGGGINSEDACGGMNLIGCTLRGNAANRGGGMVSYDTSIVKFEQCAFIENSATGDGGGLHNSAADAILNDCTFTGNSSASGDGGGAYIDGSSPHLAGCAFTANSADWGGGLYCVHANPTLAGCTFTGNSAASRGGGIQNEYSSSTIVECTFNSNLAGYGGALSHDSGSLNVEGCVFRKNSAQYGGGICNLFTMTLANSVFTGNSATVKGGGMFNDYGTPTVVNCTFSGNWSAGSGGGTYYRYSDGSTITNCIFWGNSDSEGQDESAQIDKQYSAFTVGYCCIQGLAGGYSGAGNTGSDPLLVDADGVDNVVGTMDDNLRLSLGSPCANAGLNSAVPPGVTEDIDGNPRIVNGVVDIGAYEFVGPVSLPRYEIIDLGTLGGGYSEAHGINEAGQVVGVSRTSAGHKHAFIWDAANGMSDLGTLGGSESVAYGVNGLGQVVGSSSTSAGRLHAFLWESGMMTDLGTLGGGLASEARAINDSGQVAGESRTDRSDYSWQRAFIWQDGVMTDLGVLAGAAGNPFSAAFDISASGRIVGSANERAFLWEDSNGNGVSDLGEMMDLGLVQSGVSGAYGINEMGHVVGTSSGGYAFIWDSLSGMVDLGLDKKSSPRSINDTGQIAGWFEYISDDDLHAFLWDAISGRIDLNQFLTENSNWGVLSRANSINNHGQIVGSGYTKSGQVHAFLMTPLPAESSLVAHWKLDERAGDKAEDSAGTNPGTLQGDPQWLPAGGRMDGALAFDGDDYVDCGSGGAFDIAEKITVSAWVRIETVSKDWQAIVTKGDSAWRLSTANDERKFHFSVTGGPPWIYVNGQTEVAAYEWHHVCGTYDGEYMRLYVDGAEDAGSPVAYSGGIGTNSYEVYIGENSERLERHWEGAIDDVRIYSQALSAFEIYRLYRRAPIYVDADATGANNGSSWADAFRYLQDALYSAPVSGEIRVADGVYRPDEGAHVTRWDRQATFALMDGLTIRGGYAGLGQGNPGARDVGQYVTVLSGDLNGNDGPYSAGTAENSYHVVTADGTGATAVLDGVRISGGNANGGAPHDRGAGMYILSASPTLLDCTLSDNTAPIGGGLFNVGGNPKLLSCTFSENSGTGGGMYSSGRAALTDCVFAGNAGGRGAGMSNTGYARLFNCVFVGNSSLGTTDNDGGGGLYSSGGALLVNCVLSGNSAQSKGGGLWSRGSRTRLVNCSFSANLAPGGKALACDSFGEPSSVFVANCILWDGGGEIRNRDGSTITVTNSDIRGGHAGEGNIDADPLFEDADGPDNVAGTQDDDLRLSAGSPCINTGDNAVVIVLVSVDLDGSPRVIHDLVDMGAYEFVGMLNWYVDGTNGSDNNDGLSRENAFATIQKGINSAGNGYKVLVYPGVYREPIDFRGKAIEVASAEDAAVLETPGDYAVSFYSNEGPGSVLSNFVIRNSALGIFVSGASPKITNVTVVQNQYGVARYTWGKPDIRNSIFWHNSGADLFQCQAAYSCMERPGEGEGNISTDPLFADAAAGDFHLLSERGRYRPSTEEWILDELTSPCVDSADPKVNPAGERMPNGARLNMGAYGGTAYGSMSEWRIEGDINRDGVVSLADFAIVAENWLEQAQWYK